MAFKDMSPHERIVAVHVDIMRHMDFSLLGGVTQIGNVHCDEVVPTAATDGCDVHYNVQFIDPMTRKQLRYVVLHENLHKALHHCTEYIPLKAKYPDIFAQAVDYVVNGTIEEMDPKLEFVERPTSVAPLVHPKYFNMSVPQVMKELLNNPPPKGGGGGGGQPGAGQPGGPMDVHLDPKDGGADKAAAEVAAKALKQAITDAVNQGAIVSAKLRGDAAGGQKLSGFQERNTDWRSPLRRFIQDRCEGDDQSTFAPRSRMYVPHDICMPSHFSEATGELLVACDTSGSMGGLYPTVFGEIGRICINAQPTSVRVIWWGTSIEGDQVFLPKDYTELDKLLQPKGGGGTRLSCVAEHVAKQGYKPRATIILTDCMIESDYKLPEGPILWGAVDYPDWEPTRGTVVHINSVEEAVSC